ncbi:MAG: hypothetical protein CMN98_00645 [Synechococcus sp. NP17]|nr:hypothetical protein [Synechococcus sp. NP17]
MPMSAGVLFRWGWLLGVALMAPAALPAGGAQRRLPPLRRQEGKGPLLSGDRCVLRSSPLVEAPALRRLELGTPLQMLRHWRGEDGRDWVQVQVASCQGLPDSYQSIRGWVHG